MDVIPDPAICDPEARYHNWYNLPLLALVTLLHPNDGQVGARGAKDEAFLQAAIEARASLNAWTTGIGNVAKLVIILL
jgi:hypothetical protein